MRKISPKPGVADSTASACISYISALRQVGCRTDMQEADGQSTVVSEAALSFHP